MRPFTEREAAQKYPLQMEQNKYRTHDRNTQCLRHSSILLASFCQLVQTYLGEHAFLARHAPGRLELAVQDRVCPVCVPDILFIHSSPIFINHIVC